VPQFASALPSLAFYLYSRACQVIASVSLASFYLSLLLLFLGEGDVCTSTESFGLDWREFSNPGPVLLLES
jgi:hypothetical protein